MFWVLRDKDPRPGRARRRIVWLLLPVACAFPGAAAAQELGPEDAVDILAAAVHHAASTRTVLGTMSVEPGLEIRGLSAGEAEALTVRVSRRTGYPHGRTTRGIRCVPDRRDGEPRSVGWTSRLDATLLSVDGSTALVRLSRSQPGASRTETLRVRRTNDGWRADSREGPALRGHNYLPCRLDPPTAYGDDELVALIGSSLRALVDEVPPPSDGEAVDLCWWDSYPRGWLGRLRPAITAWVRDRGMDVDHACHERPREELETADGMAVGLLLVGNTVFEGDEARVRTGLKWPGADAYTCRECGFRFVSGAWEDLGCVPAEGPRGPVGGG